MPTGWNIALQAAAVTLGLVLSAAGSTVGLIFFVASVIGPIILLTPLALAVYTMRRRRLTWPVAIPFVLTALCPLLGVVAAPATAQVVLFGYFPCILWTIVAVASTPNRPPAPPMSRVRRPPHDESQERT